MKTLQNNFTTPEQSKWLLVLGVQADSADCYLTRFGIDEDWEVKVLNNVKYSEIAISNQDYYLPCWSVGQLIDILFICYNKPNPIMSILNCRFPIIDTIIKEIDINNGDYDFSKLEE